MSSHPSHAYTCFDGHRRVATGSLASIALTLKTLLATVPSQPVLVFDDTTGRTLDIDTRGTDDQVLARLALPSPSAEPGAPTSTEASVTDQLEQATAAAGRGRGRPKLGVVPREVTLLPRHWEWLGAQPGGASVALRKLVEAARLAGTEKDRVRQAQERAYHFMSTLAGDLPGFEEATRALFANDPGRFRECVSAWPTDVRDHATWLAFDREA